MIKPLKQALVFILSLFPSRLSALSILMYHSVSDSGAFFAVSPGTFRQQMQYIRDSGFDCVFASEIVGRLNTGALARTVCVTFDDGYEDIYTNAYPVLKSLRIKATIFLITNEIGGSYTTSEGRTFPLLTQGQIREMLESGLVEFMPHGHTHRKLHGLAASEQEKEIMSSRDTVKNLTGSDPQVFAYPRGRTTPAIAAHLQRLGFRLAVGVIPGLVRRTSDCYNLPRNAVDMHVDFREFRLKLSGAVEWYEAIVCRLRRQD